MILYNWGATSDEHARWYPCEDLLPGPYARITRAVTVQAPAPLMYRWCCQIALAPYSYDFIDNFGRRSPRQLVPGAGSLVVGQRASIFELTDVQPGRQYSGRFHSDAQRLFGPGAGTYAAEPVDADHCRLICRFALSLRGIGRLRVPVLAAGDLVMIHKQFSTLKALAERDAAAGVLPDF